MVSKGVPAYCINLHARPTGNGISLHSSVRAVDLKTRGRGFDFRAGQPTNTNCLSGETLNRGPV